MPDKMLPDGHICKQRRVRPGGADKIGRTRYAVAPLRVCAHEFGMASSDIAIATADASTGQIVATCLPCGTFRCSMIAFCVEQARIRPPAACRSLTRGVSHFDVEFYAKARRNGGRQQRVRGVLSGAR